MIEPWSGRRTRSATAISPRSDSAWSPRRSSSRLARCSSSVVRVATAGLALDLGCGPGYTTRLVADVTGAARVVGVDSSPAFVDLARSAPHSRCSYEVGDALAPLAHPDADLVFCRLLLAHLPDPPAVVASWASQLRGGRARRARRGRVDGRAGARARALRGARRRARRLTRRADVRRTDASARCPTADGVRVHDEVVTWPVPVRDAAAMYRMNLATWRHDPVVRARHDDAELDAVDAGLAALDDRWRRPRHLAAPPDGPRGSSPYRLTRCGGYRVRLYAVELPLVVRDRRSLRCRGAQPFRACVQPSMEGSWARSAWPRSQHSESQWSRSWRAPSSPACSPWCDCALVRHTPPLAHEERCSHPPSRLAVAGSRRPSWRPRPCDGRPWPH